MSDLAIRVENLSKYYRIGALAQRHDTLRDHLVHTIQSLFGENGQSLGGEGKSLAPSERSSLNSQPSDRIWAIKGISFEVKHGEVVGVIGRNGTGKSTLLKILSRITEPTEGRAEIYGRIGSPLEVGTGFHPELTGRENIFLNGAILGMAKTEIQKKFDKMVEFAEIEILSTHRSSTTRAGCMFAWHLPWRLIWTRIFLSWTRSLPLAIPPFRKNVWKKFKKWLATGEQYFSSVTIWRLSLGFVIQLSCSIRDNFKHTRPRKRSSADISGRERSTRARCAFQSMQGRNLVLRLFALPPFA